MQQGRVGEGFSTIKNANERVLWFTLLETIAILGVTFWQVFYIKRLLKNSVL